MQVATASDLETPRGEDVVEAAPRQLAVLLEIPAELLVTVAVMAAEHVWQVKRRKTFQDAAFPRVPVPPRPFAVLAPEHQVSVDFNLTPSHDLAILRLPLRRVEVAAEDAWGWRRPCETTEDPVERMDLRPPVRRARRDMSRMDL